MSISAKLRNIRRSPIMKRIGKMKAPSMFRKPSIDNYKIFKNKKYKLRDDGSLAPKGSKPYFITARCNYTKETNPHHPFVIGHIVHGKNRKGDRIREQKISVKYLLKK